MKQNITVDQLNELSEEQKKKLFGWYHRSKGIKCFNVGNEFDTHEVQPEDMSVSHELFTIGQMIEFLDDHQTDKNFPHQEWHDYVIKEVRECGDIQIPYTAQELCDALWSAVKEVLEMV